MRDIYHIGEILYDLSSRLRQLQPIPIFPNNKRNLIDVIGTTLMDLFINAFFLFKGQDISQTACLRFGNSFLSGHSLIGDV